MQYVYILFNTNPDSKRKFYLGVTNNIDRRLFEHSHKLSNYTRKFGPWELVYYEAYVSRLDAENRERQLKNHGKAFAEIKKRIVNGLPIKKVRD